ncbi:histone deacetylase complex subunit SAP30 homolog [Phymastichus coffea]|uniref:histone deacetylase complex subunit SAP30 homolog n=1 Tax=Phymastichus coffea TaxID=108790 RepID=UPI00273BAD2C|nr:histone deacetylase complex subunit SAP30 homolog [Phymastichus coffea]XP_058806854.1 histone deacetylase complex subunit SAP30 homolog [Phymastichus coffea]
MAAGEKSVAWCATPFLYASSTAKAATTISTTTTTTSIASTLAGTSVANAISRMNGFSTGEEDSRGAADQICSLVDEGVRCARQAGNASYSKRIQKTVTQRRLKLNLDSMARHIYMCDYHKQVIQSARTKQQHQRRRKESDDDSGETDQDVPEVDLYQLHAGTLRRYKRHYKLQTKPGLNKAQLADILTKHFKTIPIVEKDTLSFFFYTVKTNANKLDQKNGLSNDTS